MEVDFYRKELSLKALEKLQQLSQDFESDKIDAEAFYVGCNAIWWTTAGLLPPDVSSLIEQVNAVATSAHVRALSDKSA